MKGGGGLVISNNSKVFLCEQNVEGVQIRIGVMLMEILMKKYDR